MHLLASKRRPAFLKYEWKEPRTSLIKFSFFLLFFFFLILEGNNKCMFATSSKIKNCFAHKDNFDFKSDHVFDKKKKYKSTVL